MEISERYNSVPIKDNCVLFAPTPYFRDQAIRWCHLSFFLAMATNFGTKLTTTRLLWKIIVPCLHLPPYTQLLGYIAWQWDRYLVPQNVFLVQKINLYGTKHLFRTLFMLCNSNCGQHLFRVINVLFCGQSGKVQVKTSTNHCIFPESQTTQPLWFALRIGLM